MKTITLFNYRELVSTQSLDYSKNILLLFLLFLGIGTTQLAAQDCTPPNILKNPNASDGLNNWTIIGQSGAGWRATPNNINGGGFVTSYGSCPEVNATHRKSQLVDLVAAGYDASYLDLQPEISVGEIIATLWQNALCFNGVTADDPYYVRFELRDANQNVLASYLRGTPTNTLRAPRLVGVHENVTFANYGTGARYVYFEDGGADNGFWAGNYGSYHHSAYVRVEDLQFDCNSSISCPPDVQVTSLNDIMGSAQLTQSTDPCCDRVTASFSDEYVDNEGCSLEMIRTWSTSRSSCTQRIKIVNNCGIICPTSTCVTSMDEADPISVGSARSTAGLL